ncbi:MAG: hypothetical protein ACREHG_03740 [Candidatus Saccharimonadales bacterium]
MLIPVSLRLRLEMVRRQTAESLGALVPTLRHDIWTNRGYISEPIVIHPNDRYRRVFPDGPYSQAWQGVQKTNPVADVYLGFMELPNPLQTQYMMTNRILRTNPDAYSVGAGPVLYAAQAAPSSVTDYGRPTLIQSVLKRLRGR